MLSKTAMLALLAPALFSAAGAAWTLTGAGSAAPVEPVTIPAAAERPMDGQAAATRLVAAPTGNEARYRIREHLVGMELPYDAVGTTRNITGALVVDDNGRLVPGQSRIVIDVRDLTSDKERRDGFVQRRLLETEQHPTVVLVPTAIRGLSGALPTTGTRTFELVGNLTVRGVTRPTTWQVEASFAADRVTGTTSTSFTFADFELTQPRVPVILTLADTIKLEYDFTLLRQSATGT